MTLPGLLSLLVLLTVTLLGGFSRLTHGRYTPAFYAYQIDRAPDDASMRFLPYLDFTLAALLALSSTRPVGAILFAVMQFVGLVLRLREDDDKNTAPDLALCLCAVFLMLEGLLVE
ncbi:hypothetical protein VPNG_06729 [Cytospora leucostoma]|uniref:Uncharacterized protein n=1 Tax=Cytospora leucostoma TaxID=1230097 RepID=A0A423WT78_9PEZI|nr:hypothetical protein VPNG_06729 [Cytospora leucostoma]